MEKQQLNYTELIVQWEQSGKSKAAFCRENEIVYHSFLYYLNRYNEGQQKGFEQIKSPSVDVYQGKAIELHIPGGMKVLIPGDFSIDKLRQIIGC